MTQPATSTVQQQIDELRHDLVVADAALRTYVQKVCPGRHAPTQHRDRRPPWCPHCRRTAVGEPISR